MSSRCQAKQGAQKEVILVGAYDRDESLGPGFKNCG